MINIDDCNDNTGSFNTGKCNTGRCNTGYRNTGYRNSGNYNTGYFNAGQYNSGDWNSGNRNSGDCNSDDYNSGDCNSGYGNIGDCNTGCFNTGSCNSGHGNTGNWNSGDCNPGCFNTITPEGGYYFNRWLPRKDWDDADKPSWLYGPTPTTWVASEDMTDEEKAEHPEHETTGGYLRVNDMKAEWRKAYEAASLEDREAVKRLPNFDAEVFFKITGLDLRDKPETAPREGQEIEIDGVMYVLKAKE